MDHTYEQDNYSQFSFPSLLVESFVEHGLILREVVVVVVVGRCRLTQLGLREGGRYGFGRQRCRICRLLQVAFARTSLLRFDPWRFSFINKKR